MVSVGLRASLRQLTGILTDTGIRLEVQRIRNNNMAEIVLGQQRMGYITYGLTEDAHVRTGRFEREASQDVPAVHILNLAVEPAFQGKGWAQWLIMYVILSCKIEHPEIHYAILDDDTDNPSQGGRNIYDLFGFEFVEPPHLDTQGRPQSWQLHGPERQLDLDQFVANRLFALLEAILIRIRTNQPSYRQYGKRRRSRRSRSHRKNQTKESKKISH